MVLCAGPTGSGKTTTLYATLGEVSDPTKNVMTIEDPVEYVFPSINQIQTNEQAGLTFATGLKSILRQDPDIILVGEIRDVETARIAVQSALTGHMVLSSLHATDSVSALHRFLDMGIESFLIASSVIAIVGQRLVRRICPSCKTSYTPTEEEMTFYEESGGLAQDRLLPGHGLQLLWPHGLPGPHRRLRAPANDPRDQAADRRLGDPGRASSPGPETGHAHVARRGRSAWSRRTSRRSPKSSAASIRSRPRTGQSHGQVQVQRVRPDREKGFRRRDRSERRGSAPSASRAGLRHDSGLGQEECPAVRGHEEEGAAQGHHALLTAALGVRARRSAHHGGPGGDRRRDVRQATPAMLSST